MILLELEAATMGTTAKHSLLSVSPEALTKSL